LGCVTASSIAACDAVETGSCARVIVDDDGVEVKLSPLLLLTTCSDCMIAIEKLVSSKFPASTPSTMMIIHFCMASVG